MRSLLFVCATAFVLIPLAQAQEFGRIEGLEIASTSYHVFAQSGEATVQVLVLGDIKSTGIYEVGERTDLGQLLALTGGTALGPRKQGEKREVTIRLFRQEAGYRTLVYEALLERMLAEPSQYPVLRDGDVFMVDVVVQSRFSWIEAVRTVASLATLALAIERIARYTVGY